MSVRYALTIRGQTRHTRHATLYADFERTGPNFTALLTVNEESAVAVTENSVLTTGVFHG